MPKLCGIVLLDLVGYSKLPASGQRLVFKKFLPAFAGFIKQRQHLDANSWGDAVLAVFPDIVPAVDFARDVQHFITQKTWRDNTSLHSLGVRIAVHLGRLEVGKDAVRALSPRSHVFGSAIVEPARLEPIVEPDCIWFTEAAKKPIEDAIKAGDIRGDIVDLGYRKHHKGSGGLHAYELVAERSEKSRRSMARTAAAGGPEPAPTEDDDFRAAKEFLRSACVRHVSQLAADFQSVAPSCRTERALFSAFRRYHEEILHALRFRISVGGERIDAAVLDLDGPTGRFTMRLPPTSPDIAAVLPQMLLRFDGRTPLEPNPGDGLAPYVVWSGYNGQPGVAIAHDVRNTSDMVFYFEPIEPFQKTSKATVGWYERREVAGMYKSASTRKNEYTPYRSILTVGISTAIRPPANPRHQKRVARRSWGTLNVTSTRPNAFAEEDCIWAEVCASLMATLYQTIPWLPASNTGPAGKRR